jgi:23S rRNA (guanosine2251-2'-O)-methyltransferase
MSFIFGKHLIQSVLDTEPTRIEKLLLADPRAFKDLLSFCQKHRIPVETVSKSFLDEKTKDGVHQGIMAYVKETTHFDEHYLTTCLNKEGPLFFLVLDSVTDPHNLGACLRSALAAGVTAVIAPKDKAAGLTPAARKASAGASEILPFIQVTNLARTLKTLQDAGVWIYGAEGQAETSLYDIDFPGRVALVMGSEGEGMRRLTKEHCDYLIKIPLYGKMESLNVSVAAGICLFEIARRRESK